MSIRTLPGQIDKNSEKIPDITHNLASLQFESAIPDEFRVKDVFNLRPRSHAITVFQCAQASYLVSVFNEARFSRAISLRPSMRTALLLRQDNQIKNPLSIGILGCGRLGSQLANCLLEHAKVDPSNLQISTRRPETLESLKEKGVTCYCDNKRLVSGVDLLFICVLPSHLIPVSEEINGHITSSCLIYTFVNTFPLSKLKVMLKSSNIIRPDYCWNDKSADASWDITVGVVQALDIQDMVAQTSPLYPHSEDIVVRTNNTFVQQVLYAFANMCSQMRMLTTDTLDLVNTVLFGFQQDAEGLDNTPRLHERDFIQRYFPSALPKFDLTRLTKGESNLLKRILASPALRDAFHRKYCSVFIKHDVNTDIFHRNLAN